MLLLLLFKLIEFKKKIHLSSTVLCCLCMSVCKCILYENTIRFSIKYAYAHTFKQDRTFIQHNQNSLALDMSCAVLRVAVYCLSFWVCICITCYCSAAQRTLYATVHTTMCHRWLPSFQLAEYGYPSFHCSEAKKTFIAKK